MLIDLQTAVAKIQNSKDPVAITGELVLAEGGFWNPREAADPTKLFTIQLFEIQGSGIGAAAALDDWLSKAKEELNPGAK